MPISRDKEPSWQELHDEIDALRKEQAEARRKIDEARQPAPPNPTPPNPTPAETPKKPKWLTLE